MDWIAAGTGQPKQTLTVMMLLLTGSANTHTDAQFDSSQ